jgi:predicted glycoside hydrolase/deacetylase ChbG (UPF0249 family)
LMVHPAFVDEGVYGLWRDEQLTRDRGLEAEALLDKAFKKALAESQAVLTRYSQLLPST